MAETLTDILTDAKSEQDALLAYANGVTGAEDVRLGDAVKTLADGYGQGGGGGDLQNWQLVDSIKWSYNLARDTLWNTITPSISYQNVLNAAANVKNFVLADPIDQDEYDTMVVLSGYCKYRYKGERTYAQHCDSSKIVKTVFHAGYNKDATNAHGAFSTNNANTTKVFYDNYGRYSIGSTLTYGFALNINEGTIKTSTLPNGNTGSNASLRYLREIGISLPAITVRGNNAETPVESLLDIDADNTYLEFAAWIYTKPATIVSDWYSAIRSSMTNDSVDVL